MYNFRNIFIFQEPVQEPQFFAPLAPVFVFLGGAAPALAPRGQTCSSGSGLGSHALTHGVVRGKG